LNSKSSPLAINAVQDLKKAVRPRYLPRTASTPTLYSICLNPEQAFSEAVQAFEAIAISEINTN